MYYSASENCIHSNWVTPEWSPPKDQFLHVEAILFVDYSPLAIHPACKQLWMM